MFPAIRAEAKRAAAAILFADEAGLRSNDHFGTTWAPMGRTPVVETTGVRCAFKMLSVVVGATGQFKFVVREGMVDAAVFLAFL